MKRRLAGVYFLYYGYVGATLGYLAPYLRGLGFSGEAIGSVATAAQFVAAPAALIWAHAADRRGSRTRQLRICALGALAAISALPIVRSPLAVGLVLACHAAFAGAVVPLLDSLTMEWARGAPERSYARTRLFGSFGFVLVAQGLGAWLAARGDRPADALVPLTAVACVAGYAALVQAAATSDPVSTPDAPSFLKPASTSIRLAQVAALLREPAILLLFGLCFVHWASCGPYHLLFGVLVRDLGLPSTVTGAGLALGVLAEVVALWAFPPLLRRFELAPLLAAACAGTALRWWLISRAHGAPAMVLLQLFHALSFGLWWACAVEAMGRLVPVGLRATGQALFSALVFGAGNAVGYALSGAGYERLGGASRLFAAAGVVELVAIPLCALAARHLARAQAAPPASAEGGAPPGSA